MSTNNPHYNTAFAQPFWEKGYQVVYQPSCLINNYDQQCWPIKYPEVEWTDRTVVIMHTQDFVSINSEGKSPELEAITEHFGDRADQVIIVVWNLDLDTVYNGPCHLVHFPTHSYELMNNINSVQDEWLPNFNVPRDTAWQCLNGIPRHHRQWIARYLQENYTNGVLSLGEEIELPEWEYNTYFGCENETNWKRLQNVYTDCVVNIVTETMYSESPGIITEKTLFAFLAGQIPIVIGYPGIVDHCERLGFDMFRDVVNTDYDYSPDRTRWQEAIDLNESLLVDVFNSKPLQERLEYNRHHALVEYPLQMLSNYQVRCNEIHNYLANR